MTRKKWTALFLGLLLALSLTACQGEKQVEGVVVELQTDGAGDLTAFVVEHDGKRTGVLLAEKTTLWPRGSGSWSEEEARTSFLEDLQMDALANAWCYPRREKLEAADGETVNAYWALDVRIMGGLRREALTLRDGTPVDVLDYDLWRGRASYRLADGTELLSVDASQGPENVYVQGVESFDGLSGTAKEKVRAYYEKQGLFYDETEELEKCYAAWRELGEAFQAGYIYQEVTPSAASERVMYFTTGLTRPAEYGTSYSDSVIVCAAFDRETGEHIDTWDLFRVPEEEVRRRLPELAIQGGDKALLAEMAEALEPEWIEFSRGSVGAMFPAGSLPSQETAYIISLDYENAPEGFFQPWAVPAHERDE